MVEGTNLSVHFDNPALAGQTVDVTAEDSVTGATDTVEVTLDAAGQGHAAFPVPMGWSAVVLQHPTSADKTIPVLEDDDQLPERQQAFRLELVAVARN